MIGKWHLGSDPTGFDFWRVLADPADAKTRAQLEKERTVLKVPATIPPSWLGNQGGGGGQKKQAKQQ